MESIDTPAALGRELKRWIRSGTGRAMKVPALARRLNISQSSLYAYLAGTTVPAADTLDALLDQLGVPAAERRRIATARDDLQERRDRPAAPAPLQLPPDPAGFVGRTAEYAELDRALQRARTEDGAPVVATISGPAGVGKSALAEHWAHQRVDAFRDGCLYADLRGYSHDEPRSPADVLAGFLRALGTTGRLPEDLDERTGWYRSIIASRKLLVLLDNAYDAEQVRPLLPGAGSSFAVVTSRNDLAGLSVRPGAHQITLAELTDDEQRELLRTHIGHRVDDDPAATQALVDRCAGLPLALRIVSAHALREAEQPLAQVAADLSDDPVLDQLDLGEPGTAIRTVFSWSDKHLPAQAARDFRLLGAQPLGDLHPYAAAAYLGTTVGQAQRRLGALVRRHLVQRRPGGRYGMHDLVRAYANDLSHEAEGRDEAVTRLLDYYILAAGEAVDVLHPRGTEASNGKDAAAGYATEPLHSPQHARQWLDAEWPNLLTLAGFSVTNGWPEHTTRLVATVRRHLDESGLHHDAMTLLGHGLRAARATGDRTEEAAALYHLGVACLRLGRFDEATDHYERALQLCRTTGDRYGEAGALNNLGNLMERLGRYDAATDHYQRALVLAREMGLAHGEATLLVNLGYVAARQGRYDTAADHCEHALRLFDSLGDIGGTARAQVNLGTVAQLRGEPAEALRRYQTALSLSREIGARGIEVEAHNGLGQTYRELGKLDLAWTHHEAALTAARHLADPYDEALSTEGLGHTAAAAAHPDEAARHLHAALAIYRRLRVPEADRLAAQLSS